MQNLLYHCVENYPKKISQTCYFIGFRFLKEGEKNRYLRELGQEGEV